MNQVEKNKILNIYEKSMRKLRLTRGVPWVLVDNIGVRISASNLKTLEIYDTMDASNPIARIQCPTCTGNVRMGFFDTKKFPVEKQSELVNKIYMHIEAQGVK